MPHTLSSLDRFGGPGRADRPESLSAWHTISPSADSFADDGEGAGAELQLQPPPAFVTTAREMAQHLIERAVDVAAQRLNEPEESAGVIYDVRGGSAAARALSASPEHFLAPEAPEDDHFSRNILTNESSLVFSRRELGEPMSANWLIARR